VAAKKSIAQSPAISRSCRRSLSVAESVVRVPGGRSVLLDLGVEGRRFEALLICARFLFTGLSGATESSEISLYPRLLLDFSDAEWRREKTTPQQPHIKRSRPFLVLPKACQPRR